MAMRVITYEVELINQNILVCVYLCNCCLYVYIDYKNNLNAMENQRIAK